MSTFTHDTLGKGPYTHDGKRCRKGHAGSLGFGFSEQRQDVRALMSRIGFWGFLTLTIA